MGGWFNKEQQETGNVVISKDDYEQYNDLDERNQKNAKLAKQAEKAINGIFEMIKDILPENMYHKLINQIDDRMQNPRMENL